jgi:hypothetical protein
VKPATIIVTLVLLAGCGSVTQPAVPAPVVPSSLRQVHDPGRVTGTLTGPCHARDQGRLPDPVCTPGVVDPAVTQATIRVTICRTGWTAIVRPPPNQTNSFKRLHADPAYGIPTGTTAELDHLVPLELGGSNDAGNLWPETGSIPNPKDHVELLLNHAVCAGKITLTAAQQAIAADWETATRLLS